MLVTRIDNFTALAPGASRHGAEEAKERSSHAARLAQACRRLRDPRLSYMSISNIADGCGFGDIAAFNRAFRKHCGAALLEVRS